MLWKKLVEQGGIIDGLSKSAEELSDTIPRVQEAIDGVKHGTRSVDRILLQFEEQPGSFIFGKTPLPPGPGEKGIHHLPKEFQNEKTLFLL